MLGVGPKHLHETLRGDTVCKTLSKDLLGRRPRQLPIGGFKHSCADRGVKISQRLLAYGDPPQPINLLGGRLRVRPHDRNQTFGMKQLDFPRELFNVSIEVVHDQPHS